MSSTSLGFRPSRIDRDFAGELRLTVHRPGHRTRPVQTESIGVLRMMQPLYLDDSGQVTYLIMNPGGAYFGEKYHLDVQLEPGAHLLLSGQGATRIYRTPEEPAEQTADFRLAAGSRLEYLPDQTIAYRNADYRQLTRISVAEDAQAFLSEIVTPGWDPEDTRFTYTNIHTRMEVRSQPDDGLVCSDNIRIRPSSIGHALDGIAYMEGASHMGSIVIIGSHTAGDYVDTVRVTVDEFSDCKTGVTTGTRHGVSWLMVRSLASSTDALYRMILAVNELDRSVTTGQDRVHLRRY